MFKIPKSKTIKIKNYWVEDIKYWHFSKLLKIKGIMWHITYWIMVFYKSILFINPYAKLDRRVKYLSLILKNVGLKKYRKQKNLSFILESCNQLIKILKSGRWLPILRIKYYYRWMLVNFLCTFKFSHIKTLNFCFFKIFLFFWTYFLKE